MDSPINLRPLWTTIGRRENPRLRLYCFPCAGGAASMFGGWPALLPATVELTALQLPGRENRLSEPPLQSMAAVVESVLASDELKFDLPCAFFGYSLGALVAFEAVRGLRRLGRPLPQRLFAAASPAPPSQPAGEPLLYRQPDHEFLEGFRRYGGVPDQLIDNVEFIRLLLPMLRADFEVLETYRAAPEPPLPVPIVAYGGLGDAEVAPDEVAAWGDQTTAGFTLQFFPGDHFFLRTATSALLAAVTRELESV